MDQQWQRAVGLFSLTAAAVIGVFSPTVFSMTDVWMHSRTFAHGLLVLPATGYLIWCDRSRVAALSPSPHGAGSLLLPLLVGAWLVGQRTEIPWLQQAAVVAMLPAAGLAVFGAEIMRVLAFPLGFLVFALPVGTSIEPWLQEFTAQ